ncbi:excinuclease ABC subunit UvrC [Acidaminobacter sp. JC074]|uniref:excinuclease ABC subunit UvrC n=1 Tax=Acidaminobacter sp. JC074 TaxID=2530199 RepID=UPI001F0FB57F|nr:excinuclease ABC subunit UvrC [Acidaminobacter sp. JC074]MCH4889071.1 excinuclease ABC subunit UvrC [Acidaminobacter sp. JC074]
MFDIQAQLKKLTIQPGVYLMKDQFGNVIYIGKAKNLRNRVRSYFRKNANHDKKTTELVSKIVEFEYIITDSEVEALILEASMIRKYQPQYNILLRDDKQYPYIKITINEPYPRVMKVFKVRKDNARYYGPYVSGDYMGRILELIREYYPLRTCGKVPGAGRDRPCLNYDIKKCLAPCFKPVDQEMYRGMIDEIIDILEGKVSTTIAMLKEKMMDHADKLEFEKAAKARNTIIALEKLEKSQKLYTLDESNRDIIAFSRAEDRVCFMVFFVRQGKLLGREQYVLDDLEGVKDESVMTEFLERFYTNAMIIPKEILISTEVEDQELMEQWLRQKMGKKVSLVIPKIGEKAKLIKLVEKNAEEYIAKFSEKIEAEREKIKNLKWYFKELFEIDMNKFRVEAYDISNIFGTFSVGSMVVFEGGKKKKSDYRKFNIKTIEGANDYGSMQEVLYRRFKRGLEEREKSKSLDNKFDIFPDALLIDGGLQHASVVEDVMEAFGLDIPVLGMVKDHKHKTKALVYKGIEYNIKQYPDLYKFIYAIQEEVHRFAIEHHKTLRLKAMTKSVLDAIPGVGKTRREALLTHFMSIDKIKKATVEELEQVDGINTKVAQDIFDYFSNLKEKTND